MHPALARPPVQKGNRLTCSKQPKKIGKINAGPLGERVPAPNSGIDIENLASTVPGISLEFYFRESMESHLGQQTLCRLRDLWQVNRLNVSAQLTKILGELTSAPSHNRGQGTSVITKSGIRELSFSSPRHDFLEDKVFGREERPGLVVACQQAVTILGKPGLRNGEIARLQTH